MSQWREAARNTIGVTSKHNQWLGPYILKAEGGALLSRKAGKYARRRNALALYLEEQCVMLAQS